MKYFDNPIQPVFITYKKRDKSLFGLMSYKSTVFAGVLVACIFLSVSFANAATRYSTNSGSWNINSTWATTENGTAGASYPVAGDVVIISAGNTVTVTANAACASLQIGSSNSGGGNGKLVFSAGVQLTVTGAVNLGNGNTNRGNGTLDMTAGGLLICQGLSTNRAGDVFTEGAGTVELTATNTLAVTDVAAQFSTFNNLIINGGTTTLARNITVAGDLTITAGTLDASTSNFGITIDGDWTKAATFTPRSGTVTFNGSAAQVISGTKFTTFYNLTINEGSTTTTVTNSDSAFTVTNNLTVTQGNLVLQADNADYTVTGNLTVAVNGTLTHSVPWISSPLYKLGIAGNLDVKGIFNPTVRSHVQMNGTGSHTIETGSNPASTLSILTFANGTFSANGPLKTNQEVWAMFGTTGSFRTGSNTVIFTALLNEEGSVFISPGGTLTVNSTAEIGYGTGSAGALKDSGTFNVASNLTIDAIGSVTCIGSSAINIGGNWINNGTYTRGSETVTFNGTGAQSISGTNATQAFYNVTVNKSAGTLSIAASTTTLTIADSLYINAGTFDAGTATTINVADGWVNNGTFTPESGTVVFNGAAAQAISGSSVTAFNNLTLSNTAGGVSLNGINANVNGTLTFPTTGTNSRITTGANTLVLASTSAVNNAAAGRYVYGNFSKGIPNGSSISKTFEVGDAAVYAPLTLTFAGTVAGSGNITASTTAGSEPNILTSKIDETENVNRYWTLANNGVTGFSSYSIAFTYVAADNDAGTTPANYIIGEDTTGGWVSPYPTVGTPAPTTTLAKATGITAFGNFVIGQGGAGVPTINTQPVNNAAVCPQGSVSFTAKANSVPVSSAQWQVSTNSGGSFTNITIASPYSVSTTAASGITTSVLTINPAATSMSGYQYRVVFTNSRGDVTSNAATLTLNTPPTPIFTSAPTPVCINSTGNVYSTQTGNTSYAWTISGGTIVGASTNSSVTVTWTTAGSESISVNYKNSNGCTAASPTTQPVTVGALPTPSFTLAPTPVCQNLPGNVYSTQGGNTNYQWTISGGTITAGGATNNSSATATWTASGAKSISVNYTDGNGCTATSATAQSVTVNPVPSVSIVASPTSICNGLNATLTATNSSGNINQTFSGSSGTLNTTIPDNSTTGASSSINLTDNNGITISSSSVIQVTVNINHSTIQDIDMFLVDPSGTRAMLLSSDNGGNGNNYTNTVFKTNATTSITSGSPPFTGTFAPEGNITVAPVRTGAAPNGAGNYDAVIPANDLVGAPVNGGWTIKVFDDNNGVTGTLVNWSLSITGGDYSTAITGTGIGSVSYSGTNNTTATATATAPPVGTNTYTAITSDALGCTASNTATVTVNAVPVATATNSSQNICSGSAITNISLGTSNSVTGTTFNWTRTTPTGITGTVPTSATGSTADIAGTLSNSTASPITVNFTITPYGPVTTSCQGSSVSSSVVVNPASVGGTVTGSATVCYGVNSKLLTLSGNTGSVVKWQSSTDGVNWTDIVNTATTYTPTNLVTTTQFRAVVQSGNCPTANSASATITIDAPAAPTITANYCSTGGNVQLSSNTYSSYVWSTGATTQSILVDLAGIYTLTVTDGFGCTSLNASTVATELVTNGNFSAGNTGFTSSYTYESGLYSASVPNSGLVPEGLYAVGTDANLYHPLFYGVDHTTGTGNFMMINGSTSSTPTTVWTETINIQPNTDYYFSAFCMSLNQVSPYAQLQFQANGNQVGTIASLNQGAASQAGPFSWTRFYGTWNSGTSTTVVLSIIDLQTAAGGNDFALDDISCSTLSTITFTASPNSINSTVCTGNSIGLAANVSGGLAPFTYSWKGPNSFTSTAQNPTIASATTAMTGTYTVTVSNAYGCSTSGSTAVTVGSYPTDKTITALSSSVCSGTSTSIQVTSSQSGVSYQLRNNADNSLIGSAVAGTGSSITLATGNLTSSTTFNVLATNSTTSCAVQMVTTPTVTVSTTPVLVITNQAACTGTVNLQASGVTAGSTGGGTLTYWTNAGATASLSNPSAVATSGTYYIKSTVATCFDIEPVTVTISTTSKATFSYTGTPYCSSASNPLPTFSGGGSAGVFSATPTGLVFVSTSTGQINLSASTAGTYTVKNTITPSGVCSPVSATSSVTITALPSASFSYSSNSLCQNASGSNPLPVFNNGGVAGTFSSSYGLTFVSTSTGQVNILSSTPGNYAVVNTIAAASGCAIVHDTEFILINPYSFTGSVSSAVSSGTICNGQSVNLSSSSTSYRSALLREDFNGTFNDWTTTNNSTGGTPANAAWTLRPNGYSVTVPSSTTFNSNDTSQFYLSNSNAQGSAGTTSTILESPVMNTVGYTSLSLDFFQYFLYKGGETATVQVSTNGISWTMVATYTSTQGSSTIFTDALVTLDAYINQPTFYIRFIYQGGNDYYWAIDNVSVTGYTTNNTYAWTSTPGGFSSNIQNPGGVAPITNTSYTVVATNNYGCTTSTTPVSVTVNPIPLNDAGSNNAVCNGSAIAIGANNNTGHTYSWSPSATLSSSTISNPSASPTVATTYTLTEVISSTGCSATNTVAISVNPLPSDIAVTSTAPVVCSGGSTTIQVPNSAVGVSYQLRNNATNVTLGSAVGGNSNTLLLPTGTINSNTTFNVLATVVSPNTGCQVQMVATPSVSIASTGEWVGLSSNNWNDVNNWCSGLPTSTTDVVIPAGTPFSPTVTAAALCRNLTINSGSSFTINSGGDFSLYGSLTVNGSYTQSTGTLEVVGSAAQSIPGITVNNLIINNTGGVTLGGNLTVNGVLTLTNGVINAGADTVIISNPSFNNVIAGTTNTNYTLSWVNGVMKRTFTNGSTNSYDFPVGTSTKGRLATVKSNGLTGINYFTAFVRNILPNTGNNSQIDAYETGVSGQPYFTPYSSINTGGVWVVEPDEAPTSGSYDISLYFNGFTALFDNEFGILKRPINSQTFADFKTYGGTISQIGGAGRTVAGGYALRMGLTTFSEFGIGQSSEVLPIELVSFTAEKCDDNKDALLKWSTASEENNDHFDVEVATVTNSNGSLLFGKIGEIKGNGTSTIGHDYSFVDSALNKFGIRYYRLGQVDFDGNESFTQIVPLTFDAGNSQAAILYPNPVHYTLNYVMTSPANQNLTVSITNVIGQQVLAQQVGISQGINTLSFDVSQFTPGIYFLSVKDEQGVSVRKKFEKF